mmetsp:Transcript_41337/g.123551  ORF Transcript_41337/g.123551 Transcript_41337/m.123551 type:complete len:191 (-) Transcript_41337:212-784(-)
MGNALLRCCVPTRSLQGQSEDDDGPPPKTPTPATNRVQLAASELFTVPGLATAYHTSVLVNGEEFFFSDSGILWDRSLTSHQGQPSELVDVGLSRRTGSQLLAVLQPHFMPGSYDLIQKNCNSFSDCALFLLVRQRLDPNYRRLERLGKAGQKKIGLMSILSAVGLNYKENPAADNFKLDDVIEYLQALS